MALFCVPFELGAPHFHWALSPENDTAGPDPMGDDLCWPATLGQGTLLESAVSIGVP